MKKLDLFAYLLAAALIAAALVLGPLVGTANMVTLLAVAGCVLIALLVSTLIHLRTENAATGPRRR